MRFTALPATVLSAALLLAGCGGEDNSPLKPAGEVRSTTAAATATVAAAGALTLGTAATMGELKVIVQSVEYKTIAEMADRKPSEAGGEWALVAVRVENPAKKEAEPLDFNLACTGGARGFRYSYDAPGSLDPSRPFPAGTFAEGKMLFSLPAPCKGAGVITAKGTGAFTDKNPQPRASWMLP